MLRVNRLIKFISYCNCIGLGMLVIFLELGLQSTNILTYFMILDTSPDYDAAFLADWSVVYVFVTLCTAVVMTGLVVWGSAHLIAIKFGDNARPRRKPPRYSPLDGHDESIKREYAVEIFSRRTMSQATTVTFFLVLLFNVLYDKPSS